MDALEFLRERRRMCNSHRNCKGCPLEDGKCVVGDVAPDEDYKRIITAVEQWSKEHPRKTRQSMFLEKWPNVAVSEDGVIKIRPCNLDVNVKKGCLGVNCDYCRHEFWMQEVE